MNSNRRINTKQMPEGVWDGLGVEIAHKIELLSAFTDEKGKMTRLYLGPAHRRSVDQVLAWMREAGLEAHLDAAGNVIGRRPGNGEIQKSLMLGSHIDTVRNGGIYDGTLGVLSAIAVASRLHRAGVQLPFDLEVVAFGDEEGVRYPTTLSGSRALAGKFDAKVLDEVDADGISRREALLAFGCDPDKIGELARDPTKVLGYLEVHIEQGPVLEANDLAVGIVTGISGANRGRVRIEGETGHAGTVPMALRKDALATAAEMILAVEREARARAEHDAGIVATVGRIEVPNAAVNTVPGVVEFTIDLRAPTDKTRSETRERIALALETIAEVRGLRADVGFSYEAPAAASDPHLIEQLAAALENTGQPAFKLPSGAGHDAMSFSGHIPAAMLFVRSSAGVSHRPEEYTSVEDIDVAGRVLLAFVAGLAGYE